MSGDTKPWNIVTRVVREGPHGALESLSGPGVPRRPVLVAGSRRRQARGWKNIGEETEALRAREYGVARNREWVGTAT